MKQIKFNKKMIKNKKGLSEMIGYILLITMAIAISIGAYAWLKTYVPQEKLECPGDVSILIKELNCENSKIDLTISNNGLFSIAGIIVKYGEDENQLATENLGEGYSSGRIFIDESNSPINSEEKQDQNNEFENGEEFSMQFAMPEEIAIIEITPIMFVLEDNSNKKKIVICGNSKARERVSCLSNPSPSV